MNFYNSRNMARTQAHISEYRVKSYPESSKLENDFSSVYGNNIEENYVDSLNRCMDQIDAYFRETQPREIRDIHCSLVYFKICFHNIARDHQTPFLEIMDVRVRPCIQGMGIFRAFVWRIMKLCVAHGLDLRVFRPLDGLYAILSTIGFRIIARSEGSLIMFLNDMKQKQLRELGVLQIFRLDDDGKWMLDACRLPNASVFNTNLGKNDAVQNHRRFLRSLSAAPTLDSDLGNLTSFMEMQSLGPSGGDTPMVDRKRRHVMHDEDEGGGSSSARGRSKR